MFLEVSGRPKTSVRQLVGARVRLARQIASWREGRLISQDVLAARLRIYPRRVWEIETGILSVDVTEIYRIGSELGLPPKWFFETEDNVSVAKPSCRSLILEKSIAELDQEARELVESLVLLLSARAPAKTI